LVFEKETSKKAVPDYLKTIMI